MHGSQLGTIQDEMRETQELEDKALVLLFKSEGSPDVLGSRPRGEKKGLSGEDTGPGAEERGWHGRGRNRELSKVGEPSCSGRSAAWKLKLSHLAMGCSLNILAQVGIVGFFNEPTLPHSPPSLPSRACCRVW